MPDRKPGTLLKERNLEWVLVGGDQGGMARLGGKRRIRVKFPAWHLGQQRG